MENKALKTDPERGVSRMQLRKKLAVEHRKASKGRACTGFCVTAIVLKVIAQAVTELDNKTTHCQPPVLCKVATISRVVIPLAYRDKIWLSICVMRV
ncbi:hypothetical protein [Serratia symbiotica]|uniref:hypothetical protein n=1 Tax=Serratia symbiotica TaxID=138074 RepID=UPI001CF094DE|nr:hypothetical protein [Serratia symbiotica]